jgi:hypothetical protein
MTGSWVQVPLRAPVRYARAQALRRCRSSSVAGSQSVHEVVTVRVIQTPSTRMNGRSVLLPAPSSPLLIGHIVGHTSANVKRNHPKSNALVMRFDTLLGTL